MSPDPSFELFICYHERESKWVERLHVHLAPLKRERSLHCWDEAKVRPGTLKHRARQQALASAKVAILMVSADLLACDFIQNGDLPQLLDTAEQDGKVILSIIAGRCRFIETPKISKFQPVNSPDRPLSAMVEDESEELFYRLSIEVEQALAELRQISSTPGTTRLEGRWRHPQSQVLQDASLIGNEQLPTTDTFEREERPDLAININAARPPHPSRAQS